MQVQGTYLVHRNVEFFDVEWDLATQGQRSETCGAVQLAEASNKKGEQPSPCTNPNSTEQPTAPILCHWVQFNGSEGSELGWGTRTPDPPLTNSTPCTSVLASRKGKLRAAENAKQCGAHDLGSRIDIYSQFCFEAVDVGVHVVRHRSCEMPIGGWGQWTVGAGGWLSWSWSRMGKRRSPGVVVEE